MKMENINNNKSSVLDRVYVMEGTSVTKEAQANTTSEQSNKNNIYGEGWRPSHGKNGGVGKKKIRC